MVTTDRLNICSIIELVQEIRARHGDSFPIAASIVEQRIKLDTPDALKVAGMILDVLELVPLPILNDILIQFGREIPTIPSTTGAGILVRLKTDLDQMISELELSIRSANVLTNAKIHYVGELVQKTESEILSIKNSGRRSLKEIKNLLAEKNLSLGMDVGAWKPPQRPGHDSTPQE